MKQKTKETVKVGDMIYSHNGLKRKYIVSEKVEDSNRTMSLANARLLIERGDAIILDTIECNLCGDQKEGMQTGLCCHCGRFGKTDRELALEWWKTLHQDEQYKLYSWYGHNQYTSAFDPNDLTGREIEIIWKEKQEANPIKVYSAKKQFTQFNEQLFGKYVDKFSLEDKRKMIAFLIDNVGKENLSNLDAFLKDFKM